MLFKRISKKLLVATIALIVIALVYFFPNGSDPEVYEQNIEYIEGIIIIILQELISL